MEKDKKQSQNRNIEYIFLSFCIYSFIQEFYNIFTLKNKLFYAIDVYIV